MRLNVITVHLWFENKINPPALPFGAPNTGPRINLLHVTTQRYNWLSCHCLDGCSGSSLRFPLADGSATIVFLTSMNWLKKSRELQEVLSYWHSNSIPQKLSTQFAKLLSQKRSEPNKINAPHPPSTPVSLFHWKTMYFAFWRFWSALKTEKTPPVLFLSLSLSRSLRLSPFYILLIQGDFHTSLGL